MKALVLFLLPKRFDAIALFGNVYARDRSDYIVFLHESEHARQQSLNPIKFYFRYVFSKKWRLEYEAEAYAESVKAGGDMDESVYALTHNYRLNINVLQAESAIELYL